EVTAAFGLPSSPPPPHAASVAARRRAHARRPVLEAPRRTSRREVIDGVRGMSECGWTICEVQYLRVSNKCASCTVASLGSSDSPARWVSPWVALGRWMPAPSLPWRAPRGAVAWMLGVLIVFGEWGGVPLAGLRGVSPRLPPIAWLERRIAALPPPLAVLVFL